MGHTVPSVPTVEVQSQIFAVISLLKMLPAGTIAMGQVSIADGTAIQHPLLRNRCEEQYGNLFGRFGQKSTKACCAYVPYSTSFDPCIDEPNWHDVDGSSFDCEWYAKPDPDFDKCEEYGKFFKTSGKTAVETCCACGVRECYVQYFVDRFVQNHICTIPLFGTAFALILVCHHSTLIALPYSTFYTQWGGMGRQDGLDGVLIWVIVK